MERGPNSRALVTQTKSGKTQPGARTEEEGMQGTIKQHIDTLSQFLSETRKLFFMFGWVIDQSRTVEYDPDHYPGSQANLIVF